MTALRLYSQLLKLSCALTVHEETEIPFTWVHVNRQLFMSKLYLHSNERV